MKFESHALLKPEEDPEKIPRQTRDEHLESPKGPSALLFGDVEETVGQMIPTQIYVPEIIIDSLREKGLLKGLRNEYYEKLLKLIVNEKIGYDGFDLEDIFELTSEDERESIIDGLLFEPVLMGDSYRSRFAYLYPEYGKEYYKFIGKVLREREKIQERVQNIFPEVPEKNGVIERVEELFDRQVNRILRDSGAIIDELDDEMVRLEFEHENYEDWLLGQLFMRDAYDDREENVPTDLLTEEEVFNRLDPAAGGDASFILQEKHKILKEKLLEQAKNMGLGLAVIDTELFIFTSAFKALFENGAHISLEDIKEAALETYTGAQLSSDDYSSAYAIYKNNQESNSPENQRILLEKFEKKAKNPNARFHLFKWGSDLQAFVVFENLSDRGSYMSAFNVKKEVRGYKIGEAMLTQVINGEATHHVLEADVVATNPIIPKYLETGWVATRYWDDHGDMILDITRDDTEREQCLGKQLSAENIVSGHVPTNVIIETASEQKDLPFELCNQGYVLTRMFFDREKSQYYGVFEPASPAHIESGTSAGASRK